MILRKTFLHLILFSIVFPSIAQQSPIPFQIYTENGKKITLKRMLKQLEKSEIILFGELHDNPICHWMELKTEKYLASKKPITLGAEMFETHNQTVLNHYLSGKIDAIAFDTLVDLWSNYKTDYQPLVEFAKEHSIPFIATNVPRKIARFVYHNGLDALSEGLTMKEKDFVAPLPIEYDADLPNYRKMLEMMGGGSHASPYFPMAQAIKDATMAHFIYLHFKEGNRLFLHFNGDYHSKDFEGIYWYLKRKNQYLKVTTISSVEQKNVTKIEFENKGKAHFVIVIDEEMTKTY